MLHDASSVARGYTFAALLFLDNDMLRTAATATGVLSGVSSLDKLEH